VARAEWVTGRKPRREFSCEKKKNCLTLTEICLQFVMRSISTVYNVSK
jgi:hypothetical protein